MKCYKHYENDAVSQCVDCSKGLCPECTNKFDIPLCDSCMLIRISANKSLLIKNLIIMVIGFIIGFSMQSDVGLKLFFGLFFAGIPWGWSALSKITPNIFLFMPLVGWVIYFAIKFALSATIGIFIAPFKIYGIVKGLKDSTALENYTKA